MEDPRSERPLSRVVRAGAVAVALAIGFGALVACKSPTATAEAPETAASVGNTESQTDETTGDTTASTPTPGDSTEGRSGDAAAEPAAGNESAAEPGADETEAEPGLDAAAAYFPGDKRTLRLVGVHRLLGSSPRFIVIEQHSVPTPLRDETMRFDVFRESRDGESLDALDAPRTERHAVLVAPDGLRMGLGKLPYRVSLEPAIVLPRPPKVGATWEVDLAGKTSRCRIARRATAQTFEGPRTGCAEVLIETWSAARGTTHWHDPELGIVRTEVRAADGRLLLGLALAGAKLPTEEQVLAAFPVSAE